MFGSQCREAQPGAVVTVGDTTPAAFKKLLAYLYSDELELDDEVVVDVRSNASPPRPNHFSDAQGTRVLARARVQSVHAPLRARRLVRQRHRLARARRGVQARRPARRGARLRPAPLPQATRRSARDARQPACASRPHAGGDGGRDLSTVLRRWFLAGAGVWQTTRVMPRESSELRPGTLETRERPACDQMLPIIQSGGAAAHQW
eukprot:scaffold3238_cov60-Phaeocystis_antarctica.AAC.3